MVSSWLSIPGVRDYGRANPFLRKNHAIHKNPELFHRSELGRGVSVTTDGVQRYDESCSSRVAFALGAV